MSVADHPFQQMDYQAVGFSPRDEQVDFCVRCGRHYEEHPLDDAEAQADFFAALRAEMGR